MGQVIYAVKCSIGAKMTYSKLLEVKIECISEVVKKYCLLKDLYFHVHKKGAHRVPRTFICYVAENNCAVLYD